MIRMFLAQIMFLTRIPVPAKIEFSSVHLAKGVVFAPLVGIIIGLVPAALFYFLSQAGLAFAAAASALALHVILTGALHLDGLADTADGFYSYKSREKILEIMRDSRIGTNGAVSLLLLLLLKFSVLLSLPAENGFLYLLAVPAAARMTIAWSAGLSVYARSDNGMGKTIVDETGLKEIVLITLMTLLAVSAVFSFRLIILPLMIVISAAVFASLFSLYSNKKIGGMTGDVIGAVIELTELFLLGLLLAAETVPALGGILP